MSPQNPLDLKGVEFVEFGGADSGFYQQLFYGYGFQSAARGKTGLVELYRQGKISLLYDGTPDSFASRFAKAHGPSICATGFLFGDAAAAHKAALARGAKNATEGDRPFPAIYGIGNSLIYFVDEKNKAALYQDFFRLQALPEPQGFGFTVVDHFTNNVPVGEMDKWCDFYTKVFNFRETRFFDIRGKSTGLISKVMRSPCGTFAVPINEPTDSKSQIQEYLDEYHGSGIQHLALLTPNIISTMSKLHQGGMRFLSAPPPTYYRQIKNRLPQVTEDIATLEKMAILVDGDAEGYLLQIFSKNLVGPIFFEVIERKGHQGFGEGNFQALFDAIEQDQRERGFIK